MICLDILYINLVLVQLAKIMCSPPLSNLKSIYRRGLATVRIP